MDKYKEYYNSLSNYQREYYERTIPSVIDCILSIEKFQVGYMSLASDHNGQEGDVRDIIGFSNSNDDLGIGASIKKNSRECKAPRIRSEIAPIEDWCGIPTDEKNLLIAKTNLNNYSKQFKKFNEIGSSAKEENLYRPVLEYLKNGFDKIKKDPNAVRKLFKFFVGKVGHIQVQYNHPRYYIRDFRYNLWEQYYFPDFIITNERKTNSETTLILGFNNGWTFHIRIKNGDSKIKDTSFKFNINMETCPIKSMILTYK